MFKKDIDIKWRLLIILAGVLILSGFLSRSTDDPFNEKKYTEHKILKYTEMEDGLGLSLEGYGPAVVVKNENLIASIKLGNLDSVFIQGGEKYREYYYLNTYMDMK